MIEYDYSIFNYSFFIYVQNNNNVMNAKKNYIKILQAFASNGKPTMTLPDQDLTFLISESKYELSFYDKAEINKVYDCASGKLYNRFKDS